MYDFHDVPSVMYLVSMLDKPLSELPTHLMDEVPLVRVIASKRLETGV